MVMPEIIKKIVAAQLCVEEDEVIDSAHFIDDLGADSLDLVELVMAFEEEFQMEISDDEAEKMTTVGHVIDYLKSRKYFDENQMLDFDKKYLDEDI